MNENEKPRRKRALKDADVTTSAMTVIDPSPMAAPMDEVNRLLNQRLSEFETAYQTLLTEAQRVHDLLEIANGERERVFQEKIKLQLDCLAKDRTIASLEAQISASASPAPGM